LSSASERASGLRGADWLPERSLHKQHTSTAASLLVEHGLQTTCLACSARPSNDGEQLVDFRQSCPASLLSLLFLECELASQNGHCCSPCFVEVVMVKTGLASQ
jgi:hypothetical protein